ncbi:hypothetical protein TKK_0005759 [Trichogramma kaykai]
MEDKNVDLDPDLLFNIERTSVVDGVLAIGEVKVPTIFGVGTVVVLRPMDALVTIITMTIITVVPEVRFSVAAVEATPNVDVDVLNVVAEILKVLVLRPTPNEIKIML